MLPLAHPYHGKQRARHLLQTLRITLLERHLPNILSVLGLVEIGPRIMGLIEMQTQAKLVNERSHPIELPRRSVERKGGTHEGCGLEKVGVAATPMQVVGGGKRQDGRNFIFQCP